jgi:hypothetical protein
VHELFGLEAAAAGLEKPPAEVTRLDTARERRRR